MYYIQNESAPRIPSVSVHSFSLICEIHGNAEEWFVLFWFGRLCSFSTFSRLILNIKLSLASRCPYLPILINNVMVWFGLWCLTPLRHFQQYFSYIVAVSFIGEGNRRTRRKQQTCCKSLASSIT